MHRGQKNYGIGGLPFIKEDVRIRLSQKPDLRGGKSAIDMIINEHA
jgi:hypothetical protein